MSSKLGYFPIVLLALSTSILGCGLLFTAVAIAHSRIGVYHDGVEPGVVVLLVGCLGGGVIACVAGTIFSVIGCVISGKNYRRLVLCILLAAGNVILVVTSYNLLF